MDLVGRKLTMEGGEAVTALLAELSAVAAAARAAPGLEPVAARLDAGVAAVTRASQWLSAHQGPDALAGATAYLKLLGDVLGGALLLKDRPRRPTPPRDGDGDAAWLQSKTALAQVYADQVLTGAPGLAEAATQGAEALKAVALED